MKDLALNAIHRLCKNAGAERVSLKAAEVLGNHIEEYAHELVKEAYVYVVHSRRKTLTAQDLKLVIRRRQQE